MTTKVFYLGYTPGGANPGLLAFVYSTVYTAGACFTTPLLADNTTSAAALAAQIPGAASAWCVANLGAPPDSAEWCFNAAVMPVSRAFSNPSRALGTAFQPSTTQDTLGFYSVSIASALSLTAGQLGTIVLEYADDSAFTTNVKTVGQVTNGNTGTLVIGLNTINTQGGVVSGVIPANKWARLRVVNTTGTPTSTSVGSQEVQLG